MNQEIKDAFGQYMGRFYASMSPNTPALAEYVRRGFSASVVWAAGRMIDQAEDMLAAWRRNDNTDSPSSSAMLPVIVVAMGKDMTSGSPEFAQSIADPVEVIAPADPQERVFKLRKAQVDVRVQLAIFASDEPTARSIATQFLLWVSAAPNRRFYPTYRFAGLDHRFPVVLENPDLMAVNGVTEQKNLTILIADITLRCAIPMFSMPREPGHPAGADYTDGNGGAMLPTTPPTYDPADPPGYAVVREVTNQDEVQIIHSHVYEDAGEAKTVWHPGKTDNNDNMTGP